MKKTLLAAVLLVGLIVPSVSQAAAFDWLWTLNDDMGSPYTYPIPGDLSPNEPRVLIYRTDHLPYLAQLNGGIHIDGDGRFSIDDEPESKITNLVSDLASLQSQINGKANTSHTHSPTDISGISSYVDTKIASSTLIAQRVRVQTNGTGGYTWTFPTAFSASTTPVIEVTPEDATSAASTDVRITAVSNTSVTIQASRLTTVLGLLSLNSTPQIYVHITAFAQ